MKQTPFVIEQTYNAPVEKVWQAITDVNQMRQWYFDLKDFKAEVGFEFSFEGGKDDDVYVHLCKVTEVEPGKKLTHSWKYEGYDGNSFVTWELFPEGDKTRVKLTHEGLESFPQNDPNFRRESFAAGWTHITGISLKEFVEK